jgi:hypothetical protein
MADFIAPATFPENDFRAFGIAASDRFLPLMSEENLFDPQEKRRQFEWSWQAVRYLIPEIKPASEQGKIVQLVNDERGKWDVYRSSRLRRP